MLIYSREIIILPSIDCARLEMVKIFWKAIRAKARSRLYLFRCVAKYWNKTCEIRYKKRRIGLERVKEFFGKPLSKSASENDNYILRELVRAYLQES